NPLRIVNLDQTHIERVLDGEVYHGIANYPWRLFITGFFSNELKNTVGVPIEVDGETHALFTRQDTVQQFGEMRRFLAVLLVVILVLSFVLVIISTRFIVNPVKKLTAATKKIAAGNYHLKLDLNRRDEIGRLANHFSKMADSLRRTEEKRQDFVSNVSHEIQSPLTSIQGFSTALREEDLHENLSQHYVAIIERESKRLSALGKQLLTLSFLESDVDKKSWTRCDIESQLEDVVSTTEWQWREKRLTVEMDTEPFTVWGDPKLLQQVWMNLVSNAIRYTEAGGTVTIRTRRDREGGVGVTVTDTGIGIAAEETEQIFERFYKVDKARTRTEKSTGLGLSIVKKIVEWHDGTIMVESEPGKGSTFEVVLPHHT